MSEQPREPVFNKGPSGKVIGIVFLVAVGLFAIGFAIDSSARSKDEAIGAILPVLLGLLLLILDLVLFVIWAVHRKRQTPPDA